MLDVGADLLNATCNSATQRHCRRAHERGERKRDPALAQEKRDGPERSQRYLQPDSANEEADAEQEERVIGRDAQDVGQLDQLLQRHLQKEGEEHEAQHHAEDGDEGARSSLARQTDTENDGHQWQNARQEDSQYAGREQRE